MSATVVAFLSGIIGALVGGAASAAGAITVGKMTFARDARVRIFREILPKINEQTLPAFIAEYESGDRFHEGARFLEYEASIAVLAREAQVAGRPERRAMRNILALNTGSPETSDHGTFRIRQGVVVKNQVEIANALLKMGLEVSHRVR